MRLPRAWTDADGAPSGMSEPDAVFSVDAIRALLEIVEALHWRGVIDAGGGVGTRARLGEDARPGIAVSIATAGDLPQWHPHLHMITTDGGFSQDGSFRPMPA